ncbi:MAG: hypothetical protein J5725_04360 [Bacteroidales bacterium]|nr:hypothetical protein [Bacteroidales bacterium]
MKIVIDIPDEDYKDIVDGYICQELADEMLNRVKAGTPLPKGHGDLMDANILLNKWNNSSVRGRTEFDQVIMCTSVVVSADKGE